jgi:hypothetical protein
VERGRGSNEGEGGSRRSQGGQAALQTVARAAGGRGKPAVAALQSSGKAGGRR